MASAPELIAAIRALRARYAIPDHRTKLRPEEWLRLAIELYADGFLLKDIASEIGLPYGAYISQAMRGLSPLAKWHAHRDAQVASPELRAAYIALVEERWPQHRVRNATNARRYADIAAQEPVALDAVMDMWRRRLDDPR